MADRLPQTPEVRSRNANRMIAALSLVLAFIAWSAIREAISFEQVMQDVRIVIHPGEGLTILDQSHETTDIRFRGARSDLAALDRERTRILVDMDAATLASPSARKTIKLRPANVRSPSGARPIRIEPDMISFSVDREGERQIPVKAELQEALPDGFEISSVVCTPDTVLLKGPLSQLQNVESVRTLPIDLQGRVQSFRTRGTVVPPALFTGARVDPDRVSVEVTIVEHAATRELTDVPVKILLPPSSPADVVVNPPNVHLVLQGRAAALESLNLSLLMAFVDAMGLPRGSEQEIPVRVHLPSGVRLHSVVPAAVNVRVK